MLLNDNQLFLNQTFSTQDEVFNFLAKQAVMTNIATDEKDVLKSLQLRESEGTTGMMDGFAIPHAKSDCINKASLLIVKLADGIDWNSMDGEPTNFIIALFIPSKEVGTTHLKLLSTIARMLMRSEFKDALQHATTKEEIIEIMNTTIQEEQ